MELLAMFQVAAQTAAQTATVLAQNEAVEAVPTLTSAVLVMYAQRMFKGFDWYNAFVRAAPGTDKWAHRIVAGAFSLVAAIGVHVTFTGTVLTGGEFHGTYPTIFTMVAGFWDWVKVFAIQQWAYDSSRRPEEQVLAELRAITIGNTAAFQRATLPPLLPPAAKGGQ